MFIFVAVKRKKVCYRKYFVIHNKMSFGIKYFVIHNKMNFEINKGDTRIVYFILHYSNMFHGSIVILRDLTNIN